ncbi:MAG TPA: hypothetical protein DCQ30_10305 [Acidimicrobiaceae bacterium]|nr:hypothetical protein [Acidimicrobiaceae bacterium]
MREWLWAVGSFYVLLGVRFLPAINGKQLQRMRERILPSWTAPPESVEFKALVDWQWTFGLDLFAIGLVGIVSAAVGSSAGYRYVVWVIVAREFIAGIIPDAWLIIRGYTQSSFYGGFIVLHAAIIATGLWLLS